MSELPELRGELERIDEAIDEAVENDENDRASALVRERESIEAQIAELQSGSADESTELAEAVRAEAPSKEETVTEAQNNILTKEQLGITGDFASPFSKLSTEQLDAALVTVQDAKMVALVFPGVSKLNADNREHLQTRGDVRRAARGLAIAMAGGVDTDSGVVTSTSGSQYVVKGGKSYRLDQRMQPNSDGTLTPIVIETPTNGHLDYKKVDGKFVPTGDELIRDTHAWALMFDAGYFATFGTEQQDGSPTQLDVIARMELYNRLGDDNAREIARAQWEAWGEARQQRVETRAAFAQAINAEKSAGNVTPQGLLPAESGVAGLSLSNGQTVAEAIAALQGRRFRLSMNLPVNGRMTPATTKVVNNLAELASAVAPHFAVARAAGAAIEALEVLAS